MDKNVRAMQAPKHIAQPTSETEALETRAFFEARKNGLI